jgi:hypothetical protein
MPVDVYLIDYNGTEAIDSDGHHNARLRELGRVTQWVSRQPPVARKKILVGPECFFGTIPVNGYGRWWSIDEALLRLSRRCRNVLIVPGSMLWRMRGYGGNVCPIYYDGSKKRDIYKVRAAGGLDGNVNLGGPVEWRNRSFWRRQPGAARVQAGRRPSQVFNWENYRVGVEVCNDSRTGILFDQLRGRRQRPRAEDLLDFRVVPSRALWMDTPPDRTGVAIAGGANVTNLHDQNVVADHRYVIQCEGSGDFDNAGVRQGIRYPEPGAPADPTDPPAGGPYGGAGNWSNPLPPAPPNQAYYNLRKLVVYRRQAAPNNPPFVPVLPSGYKRPTGGPTTYIRKVVYWLNLA